MKCLILVLAAWYTCCATEPTTHTQFAYNSSDLSYLSNGIQFPVTTFELHNTILEEKNSYDNVSDMEWLSKLYDHIKWSKFLHVLNQSRCHDDLIVYLNELDNGTMWATKMYDASGRYTGQFLFGNDYWLGSSYLCNELSSYKEESEMLPFPVHFYVAKVRININRRLTPVTRQLNIGQCLPKSCTIQEIGQLFAQERRQNTNLQIIDIRPVPGDYSLFDDIKFQIISGCLLGVLILIIISSSIDLWWINKDQHKDNDAKIENNNNDKNYSTMQKTANKQHQKTSLKILLSFSAITNGKKILSVDSANESVKCLHGLRFFSIAWIILVHTYLELFSVADNKNVRPITEKTFMYQTIANATFSVDSFFFISGLLVTLLYFRTAQRKRDKGQDKSESFGSSLGSFVMLILYRFLRLTPAYLFVLGVNEIIMRYLHSYSVFSPAIIDHISCTNYWWRNALYINNFFPQSEFCMLWSWYISNDTQFYFIASALLLIAVRGSKQLKFAGFMVIFFMVLSWITTFVIAMQYKYIVRVDVPFSLFDQLYDKPWLRIGPYLVGMLAGYFLYRKDSKVRMHPILVVMGWIVSLACLVSLIYGVGRKGLETPISAFYAAFGHTAWGVALAWITIACSTGYGQPLSSLLNCRLFLPLSRLTYCAYLVHPVLMCLTSFVIDGPLHLQQLLLIVIYFGNIIFSFICAFAISLAFEAPVINLLKLIF